MQFNRRELLSGMGGLAAATALSSLKNTSSARALEELTIETNKELPRKSDFAIPEGLTYINGAYTHPIPIGAADAIRRDGEYRSRPGGIDDQGLDLRIAMPKDGSIDLHDLEKLVDKKTKLIEVSLVAMYNGFQHDLKAV